MESLESMLALKADLSEPGEKRSKLQLARFSLPWKPGCGQPSRIRMYMNGLPAITGMGKELGKASWEWLDEK